MNALLGAHSGLRFLVLFAGLFSIAVCAIGLVQKKEFSKLARISGSVFVGLLDLQVLLGVAMVLMGTWYPKLIGHLVMMLSAAVLTHVLLIKNRRSARPGYVLPLIAVGVAFVLIVGGIYAIGRDPLGMTPVDVRVG